MFEETESSSSSDEEIYAVPQYNDAEFIEHFRVSRQVANQQQSENFFYQSGAFGKLSALSYTIIFLWFAGHEAASYKDAADRFGIACSTLRKVITRMIYFLSILSPQIITWPTPEEQLLIKDQFSGNGFRGVIGVIDGSHIRIDKPSEDPDSYINRKGYYSMQFQVVCDHRRKIRDVVIGFPGSVHDSRVFRASLATNLLEKCQDNYILGDSGYPCLRHLLTPFKDLGNLSRRQQNYNIKLSKTRYVIEHCFGILKQKFRQLYHLKLRKDHDIANFIRACCVLHNLALEDNFLFNENAVQNNHNPIQAEHNYNMSPDERDGVEMRNHIASILTIN